MANQISSNNYNLKINSNSIELGIFTVPFSKIAGFQRLNHQNVVRVLFTGAMGLQHDVVIEFDLKTAVKTDQFVQKLLEQEAPQKDNLHRMTPRYTISSRQARKRNQPLKNDIEQWTQLTLTGIAFQMLAYKHPRLEPIYTPFLEQLERKLNSVNLEVVNNLYQAVKNTPLEDLEMDSFIEIGGITMDLQRVN